MSESTKFYNVRARLYTCPTCGAKPGQKCQGAYRRIEGTHFKRRAVAAEVAEKERRKR